MRKVADIFAVLCILSLLGAPTLVAQQPGQGQWPPPPPPGQGGPMAGEPMRGPMPGGPMGGPMGRGPHGRFFGDDLDDQNVRELVGMLRIARISEALGLTDEQTVLLVRRHNSFEEQMRQIHRERKEVMKTLRDTINKGESDDLIKRELDKLTALDTKVIELRRGLLEEIGEGMTMTQRAKLYIAMSEFDEEVRGLVRRAREHRRRGGDDEWPDRRRGRGDDDKSRRSYRGRPGEASGRE